MKVVAIVPCHNEAHRVADVVAGLLPHVAHVVVIDDASTDSTAQLAADAGATVVSHAINRGYGAAVATGFTWALSRGADAVVMFDGDGQFVADEVPRVLKPISEGAADAVLGSRFLDGAPEGSVPLLKRLLVLYPARALERWLSGLSLSDVHNGFRAFTAESISRMNLDHDGMAFQTQLDRNISKLKLRYVEVPVTVRYYEYGQGFGGGLRILRDLLLARVSR
jgi:glycosyltransferase involved in cell wall biosynthesis